MESSQATSVVPTTGSPVQSTSKGNVSPQLARIAAQKPIPRKKKAFGSGLRKNPLAELSSPTTTVSTSAVAETPPATAALQMTPTTTTAGTSAAEVGETGIRQEESNSSTVNPPEPRRERPSSMSDPLWREENPEDLRRIIGASRKLGIPPESDSDTSLGSKEGTIYDPKTWAYRASINEDIPVMLYEDRAKDIQAHLLHIVANCPLVQWQRDRAWSMQRIADHAHIELQEMAYSLSAIDGVEKYGANILPTKDTVGLIDQIQDHELTERSREYDRILREFFEDEDRSKEKGKPFMPELRWGKTRRGMQKIITAHGTVKYVPIAATTASAPASSSVLEPSQGTIESTASLIPARAVEDASAYDTESLPSTPPAPTTLVPRTTHLVQPASSTQPPPIQFIDVSHRTRLTNLSYKDVKAFMTMLENERTQQRELTSTDALALIEEKIRALIPYRLRHSRNEAGSRQFGDDIVDGWRILPPITLCQYLLRTFKVDDKNVSLTAQLQRIKLPEIYHSTEDVEEFHVALSTLAMKYGDDFTFRRSLPLADQREVVKEWLRRIKTHTTDGSSACYEDLKKKDPQNITQFVDIMHERSAETEYLHLEARRRSNPESNQSKKRSRVDDEGSRAWRAASDTSNSTTLRPAEQVNATVGRKRGEDCHACGKKGHRAADCRFLLQNHSDVNRDTQVPFLESEAGRRWKRFTGRTSLTIDLSTNPGTRPTSSSRPSNTTRGSSPGYRSQRDRSQDRPRESSRDRSRDRSRERSSHPSPARHSRSRTRSPARERSSSKDTRAGSSRDTHRRNCEYSAISNMVMSN